MPWQELAQFYSAEGPERCGFVLEDGSIVEVENVAHEPEASFDVCGEDLLTFATKAVAAWHTHPRAGANLSFADDSSFRAWPDLGHYIIGMDGVKLYRVINNQVVQSNAP